MLAVVNRGFRDTPRRRVTHLPARRGNRLIGNAAPDGAGHPCRSHWIPLTANHSRERLISAEPANNPATRSISGAEAVCAPLCSADASRDSEGDRSSAPWPICAYFALNRLSPACHRYAHRSFAMPTGTRQGSPCQRSRQRCRADLPGTRPGTPLPPLPAAIPGPPGWPDWVGWLLSDFS